MPLFRQLWLAIILITLASFVGSFAVSILSTRSYLEQRLQRKNADTANVLARSISQLSKDPVTIGAQIGAFFESGQFEGITITAPDGKLIAERTSEQAKTTVPEWFVNFFPINAEPGQAQISENRMQFGVIKVVSHDRLAEQALWDEAEALMIWYLIAGMISGLIGMLIMNRVRQPLATMKDQAEAITERHFLTITEPRIPELRSIARATNDMVRRLHNRAIEETLHLEVLDKRMNYDPLTALPNRGHFMDRLRTALDGDEHLDGPGPAEPAGGKLAKTGLLLLLRVENLEEINRKLGRRATNAMLHEIAAITEAVCINNPERVIGRLGGADFALVLPDVTDASDLLNGLSTQLTALLCQTNGETGGSWHIGAVQYKRGDKPGDVLTGADTALASAQGKGINTWHIAEMRPASTPVPTSGISDWRQIFISAITENRFKLTFFPVVDAAGAQLHEEGVANMQALQNGGWLDAADFLPVAARLGLTGYLDIAAVRYALEYLRSSSGELAINLAGETISDWDFRNQIVELLRQQPEPYRRRLWVEVPEYGAFRKLDAFRDFCKMLREIGCRVGLEDFGRHAAELQKVADLGVDYVKIDPSFVHGINHNRENQKLLKTLCSLARTLGILVIALGVETEAERKTLLKLGVDGMTESYTR